MKRGLQGQAAMEYLMTYGWAILIVIIVAAVLYQQGILNPSTFTQSTATGFSGFNVPSGSWQVKSDGSATLVLTNGVGARISVDQVNFTIGSTTAASDDQAVSMSPGGKQTFTWMAGNFTGLAQGSAYQASVSIRYDNSDSGVNDFHSKGNLAGTVS